MMEVLSVAKVVLVITSLILSLFVSSCATTALWESTDPNEYVIVPMDKVTEATLKSKGLRYYVDAPKAVYYVQKRSLLKFRDYAIRTFGSPITVAVDAVTTIVVVGAFMNIDAVRQDLLKDPDQHFGVTPFGVVPAR